MQGILKNIINPISFIVLLFILLLFSAGVFVYSEHEQSKRIELVVNLCRLQQKVNKIESELSYLGASDSVYTANNKRQQLDQKLRYLRLQAENFLNSSKKDIINDFGRKKAASSSQPQSKPDTQSSRELLLVLDDLYSSVNNGLDQYAKILHYARISAGFFLFSILVTLPVYYYWGYKKPIVQLLQVLEKTSIQGEPVTSIFISGTLEKLSASIRKLKDVQFNAAEFVEQIGKGNVDAVLPKSNEPNHFYDSLLRMQGQLKNLSVQEKRDSWANENLAQLEKILKAEDDSASLHNKVISHLSKSTSAKIGNLYALEDESDSPFFHPLASYGAVVAKHKRIFLGNGQLGEMGVQKKTVILKELPAGYLPIQSGLGSSLPACIVMVPLLFKNNIYGALELGSFDDFEEYEIAWLDRVAESLAAHFFYQKLNALAKKQLEELTRKQADELVEIHRLQKETYNRLEVQLQEVQDEKFRNNAILEGCVDGVISFEKSGKIHFCNSAAAEIFGSSKVSVMEKKIHELINVKLMGDGKLARPYLDIQPSEKEITVRTEATFKDGSGELIDVLITSTQVEFQQMVMFTFFMQKISADLF
jgi:PAS domain S-box-containing protein